MRSAATASSRPLETALPPVPASPETWFETYHPPVTPLAGASKGSGKTPQEMLRSADAVVHALHDAFVAELAKAVDLLMDGQARLADDSGCAALVMQRLFGVAHEVKGQGRTFGYDLASSICEALCALLDRSDPGHPKLVRSINTHIEALRLVSARGLRGDGGIMGRILVQSLWREVEVVGGPATCGSVGGAVERPVSG